MQYVDTLQSFLKFYAYPVYNSVKEAKNAGLTVPEFNINKKIKLWADLEVADRPSRNFLYGPALARWENGELAYDNVTKTFQTDVFSFSGRDASTVNIPPDNFNFSDPIYKDHVWEFADVPLTLNLEENEIVLSPGIGINPTVRNKKLYADYLKTQKGFTVSENFEAKIIALLEKILLKVS